MTVYWLMFFVSVLATISPFRSAQQLNKLVWFLTGVMFSFLIGLRHEVGTDWTTYLFHYYDAVDKSFLDALTTPDPGYAVLNWLATLFDLQIYAVNLIGAACFMAGLIIFCRQQPLPWLAFVIAVPYLVIVVAMSLTRQGIALGFLFLALAALSKANQSQFVVWVFMATLFHKSALVIAPVGILVSTQPNAIRAFAMIALFALFALTMLVEQYEALWFKYVEADDFSSGGGAIRLALSAVAATLLLATGKYWRKRWPDTPLWMWLSLMVLACVPLVELASTAVDRIAIYLVPLQMVVFSRLPILIADLTKRTHTVVAILSVYCAVLWVWLNYANNAPYWLPYSNVTFLVFSDLFAF